MYSCIHSKIFNSLIFEIMRYDKEKRVFMVEKYHKLKNYTLVQRAWCSHFKNHSFPALDRIKSTIQRFNRTGSVASLPPLRAESSQKREDAKNKLKKMILANPSLSIKKT